jgi:hypothetical protein
VVYFTSAEAAAEQEITGGIYAAKAQAKYQ